MIAIRKLTLVIFLITVLLGLCVWILVLVRGHSLSTPSGQLTIESQKQLELEAAREAQATNDWLPVVVSRGDIPARTKITKDMLSLIPYPKGLIADGALLDYKPAEGHFNLLPLKAKDQVRVSDLHTEEPPLIPCDVPEGMRTYVINDNEIQVVRVIIKPCDRVDILATYSEPASHQETTQTILQNVLVLMQGTSSVTVAVKPEEVELLTAANRAGTPLRVKLRAP